jgi:uncharacterized protein involved in outer membrane biogenesis
MKFFKKIFILLPVILVLIIVGLVFSINNIVKNSIEAKASEILQVDVQVGKVALSFLEGNAMISGLNISNPTGFKSDKAFYLGQIDVSLSLLSLLSDNIVVNNIRIIDPEIYYEIQPQQTNIGQIKSNISNNNKDAGIDKETASSTDVSKRISIDELVISGAKVHTNIGGLQNTISIAEIKLNNIGDTNNPITTKSAINEVLSAVIQSAGQIELSDITREGLNTMKDNILNSSIKKILAK